MICIFCNTETNANFCPNCGEKSGINKITFKALVKDAFSTITNMDKGFLYNIKMLFINPKTITIDYIRGKRKGILNPISFLILSITLYLIIESLLKTPNDNPVVQNVLDSNIKKIANKTGYYLHRYFKYFWILSIIPLAISTKLVFRKSNFIEHLTVNSFILGNATLIGVISYIVLKVPMIFNPLVYLLILWTVYRTFVSGKYKFETFVMSVGVLMLFVFQLVLMILGISLIMVYVFR